MIVYRLSKKIYAHDLSGKGAELVGGRWNSKRNAMLYTGQSIALCVTEIAVHTPLGIIPKDYQLVHIEIPEDSIFELKTIFFDFIMAILFVIIGLFWFDVIELALIPSIICFAAVIILSSYFGIYRNHNYTEAAFMNQGRINIEKGKVISNTDVHEQKLPDDYDKEMVG